MKIFIDSANLRDIEEALKRGFIRGITTNPSLLAKEPKAKFEEHIGNIIELIKRHQPGISLSVEVFSTDPAEILTQAKRFLNTFKYPELAIKVQIGWDELAVIRSLAAEGIKVNCTCCMDIPQAVMAAAAGARYVSLFWGRIREGGTAKYANQKKEYIDSGRLEEDDFNPAHVVRETRAIFDRSFPDCEIIVGSLRSVADFTAADRAGAHIVTTPPKFFVPMATHFKTDEVVQQFLTDFSAWLK
ncbi:MAG: transaldolase [Candidatus Peregrinibacteria bacterium Greene0416_19]|nr:MAG: transaldolase [Candidatus Peregrinibacteria bacterium Greene0416_19]